MVKTRVQLKKILNQFRKELRLRGVRAEKLILFGSYAQGKPKRDSDIDIAVISSSLENKGMVARQEILGEAAASTGEPMDVVGYSPRDIRRGTSAFLSEILHTGKLVK